MIKVSIHQEGITILKKVCTKKKIALNTWAKTQRNKKRNDISTIVVGKFKNSLSESDKPTRQKNN